MAGSVVAGQTGQYLGWYTAAEGAGCIASVMVAAILPAIHGKLRGGVKAP